MRLRTLCLLAGGLPALLSSPAAAAPGDHLWSLGVDAGGQQDVDASGNVFCAGTFFGTIDFGGGPLSATNFFNGDVFLAALDVSGAHLWSQSIAVGLADGLLIDAVAARPSGGFYLAGHMFTGSIDFGGGPIGSAGELVMAHFDASGNHVWSAAYGSATAYDLHATDTHLAVTGYTFGGVDLGGGALASAGGADAFVGVLAGDGTHVFSAAFGDGVGQTGRDVVLTSGGGVALLASINGTVDFGGGPFTVSDFNPDLVLARFDPTGVHLGSVHWPGRFGPGSAVSYSGLAVADNGDLAVAGECLSTVDFGGGLLSNNGTDLFVVRLASDGSHLLSSLLGGPGTQSAMGVAFDAGSNVIVSGLFTSTIDLGGGVITSAGFSDLFAAGLDASGSHLWSRGWGSAGSDYLCEVAVGPGRTEPALLAGGGSGMDFGGGALPAGNFCPVMLEGAGGSATNAPAPAAAAGPDPRLTAWPNPFRQSATVRFSMERPGEARLTVHDVTGRRVRSLASGGRDAGDHSVAWRGDLPAGVYFVRLETAEGVSTERVVRLR